MQDYSTEVGAIIEDIIIDDTHISVKLSIKGFLKNYQNFNMTAVNDMKVRNFIRGERVRFLYASADNWTLRKYSNMYGMDKFLKREE